MKKILFLLLSMAMAPSIVSAKRINVDEFKLNVEFNRHASPSDIVIYAEADCYRRTFGNEVGCPLESPKYGKAETSFFIINLDRSVPNEYKFSDTIFNTRGLRSSLHFDVHVKRPNRLAPPRRLSHSRSFWGDITEQITNNLISDTFYVIKIPSFSVVSNITQESDLNGTLKLSACSASNVRPCYSMSTKFFLVDENLDVLPQTKSLDLHSERRRNMDITQIRPTKHSRLPNDDRKDTFDDHIIVALTKPYAIKYVVTFEPIGGPRKQIQGHIYDLDNIDLTKEIEAATVDL